MMTWADKIEAKGYETGHQIGHQEGHQEGRQEGRQEEKIAFLLRMVTRKFGVLDSQSRQRIENAGPEQLLKWSDRFVTARSLEEVFNGQG